MGRERELAEIISATGINVPSADTFQVSGVARVGNTYIDVPDGATGSRPSPATVGMLYFNTTTDNLEQYTASGWSAIEQAPTVTSISPTSAPATGTSITFTGTGYKTGCTVDFVGTDGVVSAAGSVSITNSTTLVATTPALTVAAEPYDCRVTSPGGLTGQLVDGLDAGGSPTWTTGAGSLGSILDNATGTHFTLVATDPDSTAITYTETTSVLSGAGLALNSSTGAITGDPTDVGTSTDYNFTVSASDGVNAVTRAFAITVTPSYHLLATSSIGGVTQWFQTDVLNTQQTTAFTLQAIGANITFATKAWAGGGGGSENAPAIGGGSGAQFGTYTLNENDYIFVQAAGGGGGYSTPEQGNGGTGGGGANTASSGGGGGYSGFFTGQSAVHGNSVLLAGGGGGGARYDHAGGHGGGSSGGVGKNSGGGGGTQSAGGGATSNPQAGGSSQAGGALYGGAAGNSGGHGTGGGGGGGYYGGGGGSGYSNNLGSRGGGGGSGYAAGTVSSVTQTSGADATGVPGESADAARGGAGTGGAASTTGSDGRIYITVS